MIKRKDLCKGLASGFLLLAASSAYAVPVTYNFSITGTVDVLGSSTVTPYKSNGDLDTAKAKTTYNLPNAYNLDKYDTITAYGSFTADLGPTISGTVNFNLAAFNATGNTLTIDMNGALAGGTLLLASDDVTYSSSGGSYMTFSNGGLTDFDYLKTTTPKFNSSFTFFDDLTSSTSYTYHPTNGKKVSQTVVNAMLGSWGPIVMSPVPEASTYGMMLAGLGLVGFMAARRKFL